MKVLLHEIGWREAKEYFAKNGTAILPVCSNEEHGPANPLGTDHLLAKGIASVEAIANELVRPVILLKRARIECLIQIWKI